MLIPLRTDAPLYHRPWATVGIIAANVAAFVWTLSAPEGSAEPYILQFGEWNPLQWFTCAFLHANFLHLAGNMIFLWIFGLVVEGKIGAPRFLLLYAAIAAASGCFEQSVMFAASEGGALGASGVIYGLMAISLVWAPENEVECVFLVGVFPVRFDLRLRTLAYIFLGMELLETALGGFKTSSALHLVGAAAGLPIGVLMLKMGWVDCEGWDWFSRRNPRPGLIKGSPRAAATVLAFTAKEVPDAEDRLSKLVESGDVDGALSLYGDCPAAQRVALPAPIRERLVRALAGAGRTAEARRLAVVLLREDPGNPRIGLFEARALLDEGCPSKAAGLLAAIAGRLENERQRVVHASLAARAREMREAGVLELELD